MKTQRTFTHVFSAIAATLTLSAHAGEKSTPKLPESLLIKEEFGTFLGLRPYSHTLGISLWNTAKLYEVHEDMEYKGLKGAESKLGKKVEAKAKEVAKGHGGILITDYSHLNIGTYLGFEEGHGSAVLFRLRKQFQFLNEDVEDATYQYVDDRKANDSGGHIEAAAMFDLYWDPLYNKPSNIRLTEWVDNQYRFWIRTGFEVNKNDLPGATKVDQQKFFALLNFQANPDQNAKFLWIPGREINSPQIVQLGAVLERNELTGEESTQWIVGWAPLFNVFDQLDENTFLKRFGGFGLNKRMYFGEKKTTAKIVKPNPDPTEVIVDTSESHKGRWYMSINPSFTALGQSDARGIVSAAGNAIGGIRSQKDLEKLREEQFRWKLTALVGYDDGLLELSYTATGHHPLGDFGTSYIAQEARLDWDLGRTAVNVAQRAGKMGAVTPRDWQNFKAYVSYKRGEFEPNYADVDLVSAGLSVRF